MLISEKMQNKLNQQINREQYSAQLYLAMATAFENMGLKVLAQFYYNHTNEESQHAMKLLKYVVDVGGRVELKAIEAPPTKYGSVTEIAQATLDHEIKVTEMINDLVALAEKENDYSTRSFLSWFVDEQVEEVSSAQELLDLAKMTPPQMLLALESRVSRMMEEGAEASGA